MPDADGCGVLPGSSANNAMGSTASPACPPSTRAPSTRPPRIRALHLTSADIDAIGREFDAIRAEVTASLERAEADYIRGVIKVQRSLAVAGRVSLLLGRRRFGVCAGAVLLALSKILENMEIGHNVMHGQYDWMNDPALNSRVWDWDAVSTAASWKHAHNFEHHTFTNVIGKDRDLGYSAMRVHPEQPWHPIYLLQPIYGIGMALIFEWGIALYDIDVDAARRGEKSRERVRGELAALARKAARQVAKDFILWPALSGARARRAAVANLAANVARNAWVHTIVFLGHLPDGAQMFT